jgi:hypothetical protein
VQALAVHHEQQVVGAAHQVARFHLLEARDALGDAVEAALALGGDLDLDQRSNRRCLARRRRMQHRPPAQEDVTPLELVHVSLDLGNVATQDCRHLARIQGFPFEQQLEYVFAHDKWTSVLKGSEQ